jgi:hypothetical protein
VLHRFLLLRCVTGWLAWYVPRMGSRTDMARSGDGPVPSLLLFLGLTFVSVFFSLLATGIAHELKRRAAVRAELANPRWRARD